MDTHVTREPLGDVGSRLGSSPARKERQALEESN